MDLRNITPSLSTRNTLVRIVIIAACILLVIIALPRDEKQTFRYNIGKPWMYNSFIAKYDFPIYKTDDILQQEKDSILHHFQPYYSSLPNTEETMINKLRSDYPEGLPGLPDDYLQVIINRLHRIYQAQIIETSDYNSLVKNNTSAIRIIHNKEARRQELTYIYSTRAAYEQLFIDEDIDDHKAALQRCNLNDYITPNIVYDKERTESERTQMINALPVADGMVMTGQKIIDRGDIVTPQTARILDSFERETNTRAISKIAIRFTLLGHILYVTILVLLFTAYLYLYRKEYFDMPRRTTMLYLFIALFPILTSFVITHNILSVYILPYCIAPIFIRVFVDSRTAFFAHAITILLCAAAVTYQYEFIIIQLVAGIVAIFTLREITTRSQIVRTAAAVAIASVAIYYALQLVQSDDNLKLDADMYYHFLVNAIILLLAYPLMYLVERLFNLTSDVVLIELSNTSQGVLRRLSEEAQGTFQHSVTVANIARQVANRLHAHGLLVYTGALYHDIGKLLNPAFFTENSQGKSSHEGLTNVQSAQIIISHVTHGIELAKKEHLPTDIIDFINTHHGHGKAKFFYITEKNAHPNETIDEAPFTYPGKNPFTKEQAILMMCDAVEAAARSLKTHNDETITQLVNNIVDAQLADGFFNNAPITFLDIQHAKHTIVEQLKNIYHTRTAYPNLKSATTPRRRNSLQDRRKKKANA